MYRKDAKGKEEVFLDPNTFLKTELPLGGIDFFKDGSKAILRRWKTKSNHHGCLSKKIIEDTIVDVKFSGLSWRGNEGSTTLAMKTKRKRTFCKRMNTNYISTN
jgi:prolyl oligopeptidase